MNERNPSTLPARPVCACHGRPMWRPRRWVCSVTEGERNARRVRMSAGGISFFAGRTPTTEDAQRLRTRIKKEATNGTARNS